MFWKILALERKLVLSKIREYRRKRKKKKNLPPPLCAYFLTAEIRRGRVF